MQRIALDWISLDLLDALLTILTQLEILLLLALDAPVGGEALLAVGNQLRATLAMQVRNTSFLLRHDTSREIIGRALGRTIDAAGLRLTAEFILTGKALHFSVVEYKACLLANLFLPVQTHARIADGTMLAMVILCIWIQLIAGLGAQNTLSCCQVGCIAF